MSTMTIILGTLAIIFGSNLIGLIYSWLVLYTDIFKKYRIQQKKYKPGIFWLRLPRILFNLLLMGVIIAISLYYFGFIFDTSTPTFWLILFQVLILFLVDDAWFYLIHRLLHENKFLL